MTEIESTFRTERSFPEAMDRDDPLRHFRNRFHIPKTPMGDETVYFCGNSLGLQPKTALDYVIEEMEDWKKLGVEGHFHARHPWMPYHEFLTGSTAKLVGAKPSEVVVMNSLTVNLNLLMVSFFRPEGKRYKILIEDKAFPSDKYAVESQLKFHGIDPADGLVVVKGKNEDRVITSADILEAMERGGESIAMILIGGVNYFSGYACDMKSIAAAGHKNGCVVGFDLAHATGNLVLQLHDWDVDFAAWCSYKYLNAGPGGIAGVFVHEKHGNSFDLPRFQGWWGHDKASRFRMPDTYIPIPGAEGWQVSNPPILQMAALRASMEIFDEAGMENLRNKSEKLTSYFEFLLNSTVSNSGMRIITPSDPGSRGCQLSLLTGPGGKALHGKLGKQGVICDWREPDVIRCAPVPLYNTFLDVWKMAEILKEPF